MSEEERNKRTSEEGKEERKKGNSKDNKKNYKRGKRAIKREGRDPKEGRDGDKDFTSKGAKMFTPQNDSNWYKVDETLTKNTANLPFGVRTGDNFNVAGPAVTMGQSTNYVTPGNPGIMVLHTIPHYGNFSKNFQGGKIDAEADALNTAANGLYAFIRSANAGSKNYEKSDLMLLTMAIGELIKAFSFATRAFGVVQYYSHTNKYIGEALTKAMRIDYSDFVDNLPQYRAKLNILMRKASVITVPELDLFKRLFWLYGGVFADEEDIARAQYYMFEPIKFLKYEADYFTTGTSLGPVNAWKSMWHSTNTTYCIKAQDIIDTLSEMVNALVYDDDVALMCGDIRKAFGSNVYQFWQIDENYAIAPVYSKDAIMQIHNAIITAAPINQSAIYFYEADNGGDDKTVSGNTPEVRNMAKWLTHGPFQVNNQIIANACLLRLPSGSSLTINPNTTPRSENYAYFLSCEAAQPTADDVLESTRLMCKTYTWTDNDSLIGRIVTIGGSEVVYDVDTFFYDQNGILAFEQFTSAETATSKLTKFACFDRHPRILTTKTTTTSLPQAEGFNWLWNLDTVTLVKDTELQAINDGATFGMLVPKQSFMSSNK